MTSVIISISPKELDSVNVTLVIIIGMLSLSILAPFLALYAVSFIKKKDYARHIWIQKRLFWTCVVAVLILEIQIRLSGGSGSLVYNDAYVDTPFFRTILTAHIIGAVLTYITWAILIFASSHNWKKSKSLPGPFSVTHKRLGYLTISGLSYTAITALIVCSLAFL